MPSILKTTVGKPQPPSQLPAFASGPWQMSYGERTTLEGMLAMIHPDTAIEIGRAEGGSLRRIAAHSRRVISLDVVEPSSAISELTNVSALVGDSHTLLPAELRRIADENGNVDFVLVDGDHSRAGVRQDMLDLLASDAVARTVILAHDTLNEEVRAGLNDLDYDRYEKVAWVDLDFVPGYVARLPARLGECWGGLGLVVVDASRSFRTGQQRRGVDLIDQSQLIWPAAQWIRSESNSAIELVPKKLLTDAETRSGALERELGRHRQWLESIQTSASWRLTEPLRALKRRLRTAGRDA